MTTRGLSSGICIATRNFTCRLCGQRFARMSADFILPETEICDACLAELGPLDEVALREVIMRKLAERAAPPAQS